MKIPALTAAIMAAAMVITPAAANESSRFNDNRHDRQQLVLQHHEAKKRIGRHHFLPKRVIRRSLFRRGFRSIEFVRFRNGHDVIRAYGYRGLVRLRVDARTGIIVRRKLIRPYPRYRTRQPHIEFRWHLH